ncbi:unnamed protein product [Brugia timori]|uniref:Uncharacterized protein n=1 Tax=Brugia timori TaxID=42155 RepID=A0A3P7Z1F3_9BILA|nr:unnamed protein product [Brugia timori]
MKIFYAFDDELGENDEIPYEENMDEFAENIELIRDSIISIESSSWYTITDDERAVLIGLLELGYINETMLPWNSGRPLLIKVYWITGADNVAQLLGFEILHET